MEPVRVGLVGYGIAGRSFHAPFIRTTEGMELAAIVTSDPDRREQAVAECPGAALLADPGALWDAAAGLGVELAVVAAPNRAHEPLALAALAAGLGVVVDKPLAATAAAGRRVVAEAERRGLFLSVFHNRRWDGDFLTVRRLVGDGALGEVWRFESRYERWRPEIRRGAWRESADPADAGGLLADLGSHLVDQATVLLGPPVSVYAELGRRRPGAEVDDDTFVALTHTGGARSHLWASAVASRPGPRFRVLGSLAGYEVWGMDPQEEGLRAGAEPGGPGWGATPESRWGTLGAGPDVQPTPTEAGDYGAYYRGVVASLRDGREPPVTPREAVRTLDVVDAARRSAALGQTVPLA
jgi:predicted dehydrogenase